MEKQFSRVMGEVGRGLGGMKKLWCEAESSYEFWQIFIIAGKKP